MNIYCCPSVKNPPKTGLSVRLAGLCFTLLTVINLTSSAQEENKVADQEAYATQELLKAKCFDCHGVDRQKSGLRLDDRPSALKGGNSGTPGIAPGKPLDSAIVHRFTLPSDDEKTMPPKDRPRLTAEESLQIIHWIHRGAVWPSYKGFEEENSEKEIESVATIPAESGAETGLVNFSKRVLPIFQKNCISCHGPDEQAKGLRLDSVADIMDANADGLLLVAGKADESELFRRISLPEDDQEIMPPSDFGSPLSTADQELIKQWINEGANFDQQDLETSNEADTIVVASPVAAEDLAKLTQIGALAAPIAQDTNLIQVDFSQISSQIGDEQLTLLQPFKEQLHWLDIGGTKITDDGLAKLAVFPNLVRLHLENTSIGDNGLQHLQTLTRLTYLNIFNTQVSDVGLEHLKPLEKLDQIYLWKTQVTEAVAEKLMADRPNLAVNLGWEYELKKKLLVHLEEPVNKAVGLSQSGAINAIVNLVSKDNLEVAKKLATSAIQKQTTLEEKARASDEVYAKLSALFDDDSCCAKAHQEGNKCAHDCCKKALADGLVCLKCNPGAKDKQTDLEEKARASDEVYAKLSALFDDGSCCAKAHQEGNKCAHDCCKKALTDGLVCLKCNPGAKDKQTN
ncbi:MAG: c-type cytochrome domain-containing protein [Candidatus Poribacteria bacterium]|nr:c-type cytochrome domain-containing protein [Candidatus Poribacteria bacterium]MDP6995924.1 c-type cytochrome domain-containing protein [Candidatus Poribacteria bacterium]